MLMDLMHFEVRCCGYCGGAACNSNIVCLSAPTLQLLDCISVSMHWLCEQAYLLHAVKVLFDVSEIG